MVQDFVGSNNINLFMPNGQFGTRLQGGKDSASERYIFTKLNNITRYIFRKEDDDILTYLDDDGTSVEPSNYIPIIPMILVNGAIGIGTGFSTNIPCYNPKELIDIIKQKIKDNELKMEYINTELKPYYRNFKGVIEKVSDIKYISKGTFQIQNNTLIIKELPIGIWNEPYITFIEKQLEQKKLNIKDYKDLSTDKDIHIEISFDSGVYLQDKYEFQKLLSNLKLTTNISLSNMYLFDKNDKLKKYENVNDIINEFIETRLEYYEIRKENQIKKMEYQLKILSNKYKFILELLDDTIDLRKKKCIEINNILENKNYDKIDNNFNYLVKMPMDNVNEENVNSLKKEYDNLQNELTKLKNISIVDIYYSELNELKKVL